MLDLARSITRIRGSIVIVPEDGLPHVSYLRRFFGVGDDTWHTHYTCRHHEETAMYVRSVKQHADHGGNVMAFMCSICIHMCS